MEPDCENCPLKGRPQLPIRIPSKQPRLTIVGEAPGVNEEERGKPFVGASGHLLNRSARRFSIPPKNIYKTNALLCRPDRKLTPQEWAQAVKCCKPRLEAELHNSQTIMVCGGIALGALYDKRQIFKWLGSVIEHEGRTLIPNIHPAFALRLGQWIPVFQIILARAWDQANGNLPPWKDPPIITEPNDLMVEALEDILANGKRVGLDIETLGIDPLSSRLSCVGVANEKWAVSLPWHEYNAGKWGESRSIDDYSLGPRIKDLYKEICRSPIPKVMQNGSHDVLGLRRWGVTVNNYDFDTLFAHQVISPLLKHDLGVICGIEFHAPSWKALFRMGDQKGSDVYIKRDPMQLRRYNALDCSRTFLLYDKLIARLAQTPVGWETFQQYMRMNENIAMGMKSKGIRVNKPAVMAHRQKLGARLLKEEAAIKELATELGMPDYNPMSYPQRQEMFFEKLHVTPSQFNRETGKPSLNEKALHDVITGDNIPLAKSMATRELARRKYKKLIDFTTGIKDTTRVHPNWLVSGARTGRWSSSGPNCMQIPQPKFKTENGEKVLVSKGMRDIFCADEGYYLVSADYSQLEVRILALLSGCPIMLRWFTDNIDPHLETAQAIFKTDKITKEMRNQAKTLRYGSAYGGDAETVWKQMVVNFPKLKLEAVDIMMQGMKELHQGS